VRLLAVFEHVWRVLETSRTALSGDTKDRCPSLGVIHRPLAARFGAAILTMP
jgi:hypothetical protein